jgi:hypothetical protein
MNQKNITRRDLVKLAGVAGSLLLLAGCVPVAAMPTSAEGTIVGSWITECTANVQQKQFPVLFTFNADGSLVASTGAPGQSAGHGTWTRGRNGEIGYTFVVLMQDPKSPDPSGTYAGRFVSIGTLQRDAGKDTWSGPFKDPVYDANGQVIVIETGILKLTQRIAVEPLN